MSLEDRRQSCTRCQCVESCSSEEFCQHQHTKDQVCVHVADPRCGLSGYQSKYCREAD